MARIKKDADAKPRRSTIATPTPNPEVNPEGKRPESAEPKRPTLVATMPVHHTPMNAEEEIRRRAYELYEQEGRQNGRDREHWLRAEAEIIGRRPGQKSA
jgi:hypothetical protein